MHTVVWHLNVHLRQGRDAILVVSMISTSWRTSVTASSIGSGNSTDVGAGSEVGAGSDVGEECACTCMN